MQTLPEPDFLEFSLPEGYVGLLSDDGSLMTSKLAHSLKERGWKVVILSFPQSLIAERIPLPQGVHRVVLEDLSEEHLQQQLTAIAANYGSIGAFIHINPSSHQNISTLSPSSQGNIPFLEVEKALLKQVFFIAKHLKKSLNSAAEKGRSCFVTVARLDGKLGLGRDTTFGTIGGGLFGLTKTLNQEWDAVFCRAIDLSVDLGVEQAVESIIAEIHDPNRLLVEVGYNLQSRVTLGCEKEPKNANARLNISAVPTVDPQSLVFLVSGGAKGITARCAIKLAQHYKCKFILLGRSSNTESEPEWAKDCFNESELKKRIMEYLLAKGEKPIPSQVQKLFNQITSQREIENTLCAIVQAGGQAEYLSVDVTDAVSLQEKITSVTARVGAITGIIHGAGNLADKRIENKTERDFDNVYNAKVTGLENLLRCVPVNQLQHLVLFSSVVGFYGNVGQADYALANEILNKTAHVLKQSHPSGHVVAINWGPWESGMVTPELKQAFAERNIEVIPIDIGTQLLLEELNPANHNTVQVVIGSPLVPIPAILNSKLQTYRVHRKMTVAANPFLHDHVIAGRPVLPAACALAWITNTCEQIYPGYKCFSIANYKVLKGIVFDENLASGFILDLKEINKTDSEVEFEARISSKNLAGKIQYHFSAQVKLAQKLPSRPIYDSFNLTSDQKISANGSLYQQNVSSLFHGFCFQGIKAVLNISPKKFTTQCFLPDIGNERQGQFPVQTLNPYIFDVQIQSLWIWTQYFYQEACLPSAIQYVEQFAPIPFEETFYISGELKSKTESSVVANLIIHNQKGEVYAHMVGAQGTILPGIRVNQPAMN